MAHKGGTENLFLSQSARIRCKHNLGDGADHEVFIDRKGTIGHWWRQRSHGLAPRVTVPLALTQNAILDPQIFL